MKRIPIKMITVGDGTVGKTSLLIVYVHGTFPTPYVPTVFDNYAHEMEVDDTEIILGLWDTGGGEDYHRLRPLSYPQTDVFLLCYSVENQASFDNIPDYWNAELKHHCPNVPVILVANKIDLRDEETKLKLEEKNKDFVTIEEGEEMASKINAYAYLECSAITKEGVQEVFETVAKAALQYLPHPENRNKNCRVL